MIVGDTVRYVGCNDCGETAKVVEIKNGMVRIVRPSGIRTWADPESLEVAPSL